MFSEDLFSSTVEDNKEHHLSIEQQKPKPLDSQLLSESTCSNGHDSGDSSAIEVIDGGITSILGSVIRVFDIRADSAIKSQDALSNAIDRLTGELDQLLEGAPLPFILQHAAKISGVRRRVSSLNPVLESIQQRIDSIDRMLFAGLSHDLLKADLNSESDEADNSGSMGRIAEGCDMENSNGGSKWEQFAEVECMWKRRIAMDSYNHICGTGVDADSDGCH